MSTKKGNAENGRSILLTKPTKRCLASYSCSAQSVKNSLHVRESGFRNPRKFLFVKSGILVLGIWDTAQGIPNFIND